MTAAKKTSAKPKKTPRPVLHRKLTIEQRAEAAALWRAGSVTLGDLSKKYGKRPETFSRMFKLMGLVKGSAAVETAKKLAAALAAASVSSVSVEVSRIAAMKDEHFKFSSFLAKTAMGEIFRARTAGLDLAGLRETMLTLKLAGEVVSNSRKELYALLRVEEHDLQAEIEDLPELSVAELTPEQVAQMQAADIQEEIGIGRDLDDLITTEDPAEGL